MCWDGSGPGSRPRAPSRLDTGPLPSGRAAMRRSNWSVAGPACSYSLPHMDSKDLFTLALGLTKPWYVVRNELDTVKRQLEIGIDFERGGTFPCPECGQAGCKAYDTEERRWRHLNFFQFETVLSARVPRIDCGS